MSAVSLDAVHDGFGHWLALPDPQRDGRPYEGIDVALATVVANRMPGDPLWVFVVGPPSSGKTEIIRTLDAVPDVFPLSSLTAQTFASGFERKGTETSLLPKLDGKTVTMKDFGTVLTMYREKKAEILAQLREIYDGSFVKEFGNGKAVRWSGKVGLLAGVTPTIDREYGLNHILGERFLLHRVKSAPARDLARRAIAQRQHEGEQRARLRSLVADFLAGLSSVPPLVPASVEEAIAALAEFAALARSPILFNPRGEIDLIPAPEGPGRLAKQFVLLAQALAAVRSEAEVSPATFVTIYQVAEDTIPAQRRVMLEVLLDRGQFVGATTTDVAETTGYPTATARRYLQELAALRLVERLPEGQGKPDRWRPSETLTTLLDAMKGPMRETDHLFRDARMCATNG